MPPVNFNASPLTSPINSFVNPTVVTSNQTATMRGDNGTSNQNTVNGKPSDGGSSSTAQPQTLTGNDSYEAIAGQTPVISETAPTTYSATGSVGTGTATNNPEVTINGKVVDTSATTTGTRAPTTATVSEATATSARNKLAKVDKLAAEVNGASAKTPANHAERVEQVQKAYKSLSGKPAEQAKFKNEVLAQGADYGLNFGFESVSGPLTPENQAVQQALHQEYLANKGKTSTPATTTPTTPATATNTAQTAGTTARPSTVVTGQVVFSDKTRTLLANVLKSECTQAGSVETKLADAMKEAGQTEFKVSTLRVVRFAGEVTDPAAQGELKSRLADCKTAAQAAKVLVDLARRELASPGQIVATSAGLQTATA